jgi:hypothetical protein
MTGGQFSEADRLIGAAAKGADLSTTELRLILEHVAQAGFDPHALEQVRGRLAGIVWRGRVLGGKDRLPPSEVKYLWHVLTRREWPPGTSLRDYTEGLRQLVLDASSGVFTNRYQGALGLAIMRESRDLRGPEGFDWVLVQYRVDRGHWTTAFQPEDGLDELHKPNWSEVRWLRQPRRSGEP